MTRHPRLLAVFTLSAAIAAVASIAGAPRQVTPRLPAPCSPGMGEPLRQQLTPWLSERASSGQFSGVVLIACGGQPIYQAAYGLANRATGAPVTMSTRFNLGSINKMWTAVAVAQLVEQGKIDIDAPVGKYLPDLANVTIRDSVLIRHLLTHTSGLGSYFHEGFLVNRVYATRAADYLPFFIKDEPVFTPGAKMLYSNAGYALLGVIVERVSGQSYFDYVRTNVIEPAGMKTAAFADLRAMTGDMAVPYGTPPGASGAIDVSGQLEARGGPAGGAYASAADLVSFSRALWSGRLAGMATVAQFTIGKVEMGPTLKYAFGFGVGATGGWRHVGHNGGAPGVGAEFLAFPDHQVDLVVLTNIDMPVATDVAARATAILTGASSRSR